MTENKVVPKLRFDEFKNEKDTNSYKKYSFTDVFLFSTGKNIKQNEASPQFKTPCVRYGELYHMYGEVIYNVINKTNLPESELLFSKGNEILLPSAGEEPIGIGAASALPFKNIAIGRTINVLSPKIEEMYSQYYVSYYINEKLKKKIARLAKGVSISNVYNSDLKKLKIILPRLKEQQKVDSFLSAVDKKLQQLTKKKELLEEYKKGVMQKIFSQEFRFKGDNGSSYPDWEEKNLGEVDIYISDGNYGELYPKASEMKQSGIPFIRANNIKNLRLVWNDMRYIDSELHSILTSGHLKTNDILVTTRGDIGTLAIVSEDFNGANINAQICLLRLGQELNAYFLLQFLGSVDGQKQFKRLQTGSALKQLPKGNLRKIKLKKPILEEQEKIANFLSSLDCKIELVSTQIENTKAFKKGLLQQMFV